MRQQACFVDLKGVKEGWISECYGLNLIKGAKNIPMMEIIAFGTHLRSISVSCLVR